MATSEKIAVSGEMENQMEIETTNIPENWEERGKRRSRSTSATENRKRKASLTPEKEKGGEKNQRKKEEEKNPAEKTGTETQEKEEGINSRTQTIRKVTEETNKALTEIAKAIRKEMAGKISFTKEDQKRILTASGEIKSGISELLLEVIGMQEETRQAEARATKAETETKKLRERIRQLTEEKEAQTRPRQKKTEGEKDLRGHSQKKLDQLRKELHEEAVREETQKRATETTRSTPTPAPRKKKQKKQEGEWTTVSYAQKLKEKFPARHETLVKLEGQDEAGAKRTLSGLNIHEIGGPLAQVVSRKDGSQLLVSQGTGGNLEEETGGQGNSGRKAEPNHHAHRVGKRVETGGSGGGHLGEKRMDPDGKDQRAIHRGGESALEESLQGSQQTERRPDNGRKNAGRMFEKEEGSGGADLLLDGRKIRGEPVLQLSRLRPSEEGLQAGVDLLQVRGSAHQEGLQGRKEELPELRQRGTEGSEPPSHRQMVPGVPTEAGNQSRQDSTQLSREEENRDVRDPRGTRDKFVVLQANLGRGREATDLLQRRVARRDSSSVREPSGQQTRKANHHRRGHPAFGGEEEDVRGRQIIDLVGAANLVVENDRDSIPTFETANGKSWIDITLSRDATVESWAVREEETLSDHRSIFFSVDLGEAGNDQPKERKRIMMVHQADWQLHFYTKIGSSN
jgi:hypothetical protein